MSRKRSSSHSSNDKEEEDNLEKEFLNCEISKIPIPLTYLEDYDSEILEIMKSGCNRQIAEYVINKYIDEEKKEKENKEKKENKEDKGNKENKEDKEEKNNKEDKKESQLSKFKDEYVESLEKSRVKETTEKKLKSYLEDIRYNKRAKIEDDNLKDIKEKLTEYDFEVEKILVELETNFNDAKMDDEEEKYKITKYFFIETLESYDDKENLNKLCKKYIDKREAVIEFGLRNVKKIINDDKEFKKFSEEYESLLIEDNKKK